MSDLVIDAGTVTTIRINRPDKRNSLTLATTQELAAAVEDSAPGARAIIITGEGAAFCAGGDFEELERFAKSSESEAGASLYGGFQKMIRAIREVDVPVIAAVNGHAMGAGMDLALACDLRVAASGAKLGQVWVGIGIIPGTGGAFWTTALAGPGRAAQMILTGEPIDADMALAWGLVNQVVPLEALMSRTEELASSIARHPRGAVAANKAALNEILRPGYEAALSHAVRVQPQRFRSEEFAEALSRARPAKPAPPSL